MDTLNKGAGPGEGYRSGEAASEDDVEGHGVPRAIPDEDDTEGHAAFYPR